MFDMILNKYDSIKTIHENKAPMKADYCITYLTKSIP